MPQPTLPAQRVPAPGEEAEDIILGVDTHKDIHVAAVITTLGASLAQLEFPATANCVPGQGRSVSCTGRASSARAPSEPG
ncbi:hypothetical protein ABZ348_30285 [Streptomyces sp. NPDC005963]|uniref:hypothetical protein n=1 Tax=Streptomyces sp. NPDC005963 TaxID=3156721 RepID=UPI0033D252F5